MIEEENGHIKTELLEVGSRNKAMTTITGKRISFGQPVLALLLVICVAVICVAFADEYEYGVDIVSSTAVLPSLMPGHFRLTTRRLLYCFVICRLMPLAMFPFCQLLVLKL